jgi:putative two-component system response regulator
MEKKTVKEKILVVDDEVALRNLIALLFRSKGYDVIMASDGKEALEIEERYRPDIVLLDVDMPGMDGFQVCKAIRAKRNGKNYIPIVFLSAVMQDKVVVSGLELGADDYVRKPFESIELITRAKNLLKMKNFIRELESIENVIFSLIRSIEARDSYTAGHSVNVADIASNIGREMGLGADEIRILNNGSLLHDIGKIGVPDSILNNKGKLDAQSFGIIMEHPRAGREICRNLSFGAEVIDIIHSHHEKLDGSGYPEKLGSEQISKFVRIVTVSDIFDALTTDRPYRLAEPVHTALSILNKEVKEGKLDKTVVQCLEDLITKESVKKKKFSRDNPDLQFS